MVTDAQVSALRAALVGDSGTFDRLGGESGLEYGEEFPVLMAMAFINAARRRFGVGWSRGDVVRFVGQLRARDHGEYSDVSSEASEQMLIGALRGEPFQTQFDEFAKGYALAAVLAELVSGFDAQRLSALLREARQQADQWLAGQTRS
jgi:hypothetical protein